MLNTSITLLWSAISSRLMHVAYGYLGVIGLDPRGLPAEGTPKLKLAKSLRKSNQVIREVMNAYL